ncbi:MAG TPA: hypothetical protein VMW10_10125 [Alphaproteobacteria bacterium]|nr:hypothetical protein [Alphaproteobacteria bacterium]
MPDQIVGILIAAGVPALLMIWNLFASREQTVIWGWVLMAVVGTFFNQRLGLQHGKAINNRFGTTLDDLTFGARLWLQGKPKPTKEELKERTKKLNGE